MAVIVAVPVGDGTDVLVEMDGAAAEGVVKAGRAGLVAGRAAETLQQALDPLVPTVRAVMDKLREVGPTDVAVEFGVKLTAEAGAVITRTSGECNLLVTLRWDRRETPDR